MALPWLKVLKSVPWSEVLAAAPQVANGARRLWDTVGRKPGAEPQPDLSEELAHLSPQEDLRQLAVHLAERLDQHEAALGQVHGQLRDASRLIAELADQNAQLIAKMEAARERLNLVGFAAAASGVVAVVSLALVLART